MIRPPPRSTLSPHTTLSRPPLQPRRVRAARRLPVPRAGPHAPHAERAARRGDREEARLAERRHRSEEHTSELQSRQYLVCRLLLEKKKIKKKTHIQQTPAQH